VVRFAGLFFAVAFFANTPPPPPLAFEGVMFVTPFNAVLGKYSLTPVGRVHYFYEDSFELGSVQCC
jgi:hypothetical protein